jgi:glycosyltransferase involved in cell wall biosynthesis
MRVLLDATFLNRGPTGTGTYAAALARTLPALGVEVVLAGNPHRRPPAGGGLGSVRNAAADLRWELAALPRIARAEEADLVHHPLPAVGRPGGPPRVVTVHDLAFLRLPELYPAAYRRWAALTHRAAARSARVVVVPSETTARDVRARWGVPAARIVVAPHGPGQPLDVVRAAPAHLLYVGDDQPRKNLPRLLAAHARYSEQVSAALPLVLAGGVADPRRPGVRVEPRPDPWRLAELLGAALALVHPALHEGFGLTPLEAMAAGVPVVAARAPGVTEACGPAALYFDPLSVGDLAGALERISGDPALRDDLAARGRARAAGLSWERAAEHHLAAYTLALAR